MYLTENITCQKSALSIILSQLESDPNTIHHRNIVSEDDLRQAMQKTQAYLNSTSSKPTVVSITGAKAEASSQNFLFSLQRPII